MVMLKSAFLEVVDLNMGLIFSQVEGNRELVELSKMVVLELSKPGAIEIIGGRDSGKSWLIRELFRANPQMSPVLVVTKGKVPEIPGCEVLTCTSMEGLLVILSDLQIRSVRIGSFLLGIDTLVTLVVAAGGTKRLKEVNRAIRALVKTGVRVVVVNSTIYPVVRTSSLFSKSIRLG
ncbi:hypothetical protein NEHOM01_2189 [Nematocida homosporus]|uniref:uncharacterized protein n=1 Tax=Nematocida homosporus TaxID=1912981 RepID=UPI00221FBC17|nr:uncharacterized protein NEHOM01_2189 [Nematocida homosporus]KAI5187453.1 hypothetical protein NEHOM01_2189 [Nematocida homosporus]